MKPVRLCTLCWSGPPDLWASRNGGGECKGCGVYTTRLFLNDARPGRVWRFASNAAVWLIAAVCITLVVLALHGCGGDMPPTPDAGAPAVGPCYPSACAYCRVHVLTGPAVPVERSGDLWCDPPSGPADVVDCTGCQAPPPCSPLCVFCADGRPEVTACTDGGCISMDCVTCGGCSS